MENMAVNQHIEEKEESISKSVAAGATVSYFSLDVPSKSEVRMTRFANYTDTPAAWGFITWSVRRNGVGVYPFDTMKDQYGLAAEPRPFVPIPFTGGDKFEVIIINTFPAAVKVGVAFRYEIGKKKR